MLWVLAVGGASGMAEGSFVLPSPLQSWMTSTCSLHIIVVWALAGGCLESGACVYSRIMFLCSKNGTSVRLGCFVAKFLVSEGTILTGEPEVG